MPTPKVGVLTDYFANCLLKSAWKLKDLDLEGSPPPPGSTNGKAFDADISAACENPDLEPDRNYYHYVQWQFPVNGLMQQEPFNAKQ